jgi:hypothetical protein
MTLAAIANDGDFLAPQGGDVSVFFVKASWHKRNVPYLNCLD